MENVIKLNFGSLTRIAGNPYGVKVYNEQIKNGINWDCINIIQIPDHVTGVSISFVQGLMHDIVKKRGKGFFVENFRIISSSVKVQEKINEAIIFGE